MRHLVVLAACVAAGVVAPAAASDHLDAVLHRKLPHGDEWFSPSEAAFIRTRCGYAAGAPIHNLDIHDDVMTCNGRSIRDPRVRAIDRAVSARAKAQVQATLNDPEVKAAMRGEVAAAERRALTRPR